MQVSPKVLEFKAPFTAQQTQEVTVSNDSASYIAFKVKTTAPKLYCVRPNASTVAPGGKITVNIILQGLPQEPAVGTKCKDKFLFVSVPCDESVDPKSVSKQWSSIQKAASVSSTDIKMKVSYKYDGGAIAPIKEETASAAGSDASAATPGLAVAGAAGAAGLATTSGAVTSGAAHETQATTKARKVASADAGAAATGADASPAAADDADGLVPTATTADEKAATSATSADDATAAAPAAPAKTGSSISPALLIALLALVAFLVYKYVL